MTDSTRGAGGIPSAGARARAASLPIVVALVLVDAVTKWFAVERLSPRHVPHPIIGDVLRFTLAYNPGAAFGLHLGEWSRWIFTALALGILFFLWKVWRETPDDQPVRLLALAMVAGGAIGNLVDRIRSPLGVVDFIDVGFGDWRFWTFNVADMGVSVGTVLLLWSLRHDDEPAPARADRPSEPPAA